MLFDSTLLQNERRACTPSHFPFLSLLSVRSGQFSKNGRSGDSWAVPAGQVDRRQVFLSHLFAARDARVEGENINKHTSLLWQHIRAIGEDLNQDEDLIYHIRTKVTDMHTECKSWATRGECRRNPTFMAKKCKISCGISEYKDEL